MAKKRTGRVAVVSDLHCGHRAGLTPPEHWQVGTSYVQQQEKTWEFYTKAVKSLGHVDVVICNGDAIDGKGERSGGTEIYQPDRGKQVEIAEKCLREFNTDKYLLTYGTPYHVGKDEDWEKQLAWKLDCEIEGHLQWEFHGIKFDVTHKIGSSTIPHGRFTAIARAKLWNSIWALKGGQVNADIVIRSHVHYHLFAGDSSWLGVITPALQGFGSKYGVRQCQGTVDFGLIYFDFFDDGTWSWGSKVMQYEVVKKKDIYESRLK